MFKIKPIKWNIFVLLKKKLMERITSFCGSFLKAPLICTRKTLLDQIVPMHKKIMAVQVLALWYLPEMTIPTVYENTSCSNTCLIS